MENKSLSIIIMTLLLVAASWFVGYCTGHEKSEKEIIVERDTVTVTLWDTVRIDRPVPVASTILKDSIHALIAINDLQRGMIDIPSLERLITEG